MATSKRCKKRPFSLSLSQSTGMDSSKIRKKKNTGSHECDISGSTSRSLSIVSETEDNPKRKFVEEWLENSNPDSDVPDVGKVDESSQETVLLEVNNCVENSDKTCVAMDQEGEQTRKNVVTEGEVVIDNTMKEDKEKVNTVNEEVVESNIVKGEDVEGNSPAKANVEEGLMENEPGMSSGHVTEEEPLLQCPLCWKNFEKSHTQAAHLKACASANGLTTRQLIDAVDLHKKQLAERRKLGLFPMVPPPAANKKPAPKKAEGQSSRKSRHPKNNELELALALSLSLAQREGKQESLNAFGFTSKSNGSKKPVPVLLTRTQAERERLITEKVSIVLLEEPGLSQTSNGSQDVHPTVQSAQLQEWCDEDYPLWKKSYVSPSQNDVAAYYVSALGQVIVPSKTEVGANLLHISQVPGRLNTPKKSEKPEEKAMDDSSVSECHSASNTLSLSKLEQDVKAKHLSDWASMFKNSSMSDVSIYVRGGRAIPAHKLVLTVRCPLVLRDVTKQQNHVTGLHVDVILWPDISNDAALCFLEYVYYGSIRSIHTLRKDMTGLNWLASRYEANDLTDVLSYFKSRKRAVMSTCDEASLRSSTPDPAPLPLSGRESLRSRETVPMVHNVEIDSDEDTLNVMQEKKESNHSIHSQKTAIPQERTQSPDIFSDEYEFALSPSPKSRTSREDIAMRKLSFDSPLKQPSTWIESLSTGSPAKPYDSNEPVSPRKMISVGMSNSSASPQLEQSAESSSRSRKSLSPPKVINLSPFSDVPECDTGSKEPDSSSQRPVFPDDDIVILSDDDEPEKDTVPANQNRQDILSITTASLKSPESPSADRNSPYISPVWKGFDDMPCDIDMGTNWNDEDVNGISPVRESTAPDTSLAPGYNQDSSPKRCNILDKSPGRSSILDKSPVRANIREISPVRANIRNASPVRGRYERTSSFGDNKVHNVSDSASSEDEVSPGNIGNDLLDDSMNAILASSILDRAEREHLTPKRTAKKKKDGSGAESGRVTPMKNYRGMTTPELKAELQKFGMKPLLGKRKGIKMLEHIYNELHPWVPLGGSFSLSQATTIQPSTQRLSSSQPCPSSTANVLVDNVPKSGSSSTSSSSGSSAEGLSDVECDDSDSGTVVSQQGAKRLSASELSDIVSNHIKNDKVLHRKVLEYEPVFVEHLYCDIKSKGYKFKIADLMAYLGEKCINYRSLKVPSKTRKKNEQNGNQKTKRRPDFDLDSLDSNAGFC